jgi:CBS domain-containing protein
MAFTLEDLLPSDQQLRTIYPHEPVSRAIDIMNEHGYSQLPVTDSNGEFQGEVVTFESILRAVEAFRVQLASFLVRDVSQNIRGYPRDADLLETLDDIQRDNFALIVDGSKLVGIVTTADTAVFFRSYAQDLMQIEGIESSVKDAIRALYQGDNEGLDLAITTVTDRGADIRKRLPTVIRAYLQKTNISLPADADQTEALAEAEMRLGISSSAKKFEELTFDEYIHLLCRHPRSPKLSAAKDVTELRGLLQQVRDIRNKLAHFRGELTAEERRTVQFAAEWLERNLPQASAEVPMPIASIPRAGGEQDESDTIPQGSYANLAIYLRDRPTEIPSVTLAFQEIESILAAELPPSAYKHRAWWSNDPTKPQSLAWLEEGWRTTSVNMTEQRLTFVRTNVREEAYINFFARLKMQLAAESGFPLRDISPQGQSWHVLASLDQSQPDAATITASFARRQRLRMELYIDSGNKEVNKLRFDFLATRKEEIERVFGEPLEWERLDDRRACRVAVYTKAQILSDSNSAMLVEWATRRATRLYRVFEPELSSPPAAFDSQSRQQL